MPDFTRDVHCLLGLPFDAVDLDGAARRLRAAAAAGERCVLATPNLNFVVAAQDDAAFRDSVIRADLCVADGMPLVWTARLLGLPLAERVAGSTLFERLRADAARPLGVFFFGGADGVAAQACARLNAEAGGVRCVGWDSPGFEPVPAISGAERIARINASGADFLVVSLGARKGQAWIEHNLGALAPPLVSHLGAVVNFVAGTVRRAPPAWQRAGLEWLWRIREEPALWRRYAGDALGFARLALTRLLPYALHLRLARPSAAQLEAARVDLDDADAGTLVLRLRGAWSRDNLAPLRTAFARAAASGRALRLDLAGASHVDAAVLGLVSLLWAHAAGRGWAVDGASAALRRVVHWCGADHLLQARPAP